MKKHFIVIFFLLCGLGVCVKAQTDWNKTYIEDRPTMLFSSVVFDDTCYKVTGGTYGYINNLPKGLIANVDLTGDLTNYKIVVDSNTNLYGFYMNSLMKNSKGEFAFTGQSYDSLAYLLFCIANKQLDSISVFRYYTPNTFAFHGYCLLQKDSSYYISGLRTDSITNNPNVVLVKIDSIGNRLWEKNYGTTLFEEAQSMIRLNNGNLMLGCIRSDLNQHPTNEHANTWLLEVNDTGGVVRQWFDPNDSTYAAYGLKQTSDGGFIYGAQKQFLNLGGGLISYRSTVVKMNNNFAKQWSFYGGDNSIYTEIADIEELPDGNFIACGSEPYYEIDTNTLGGWVIKFDTAGHVIWERNYRGINASQTLNFLTDIDVLPDGSLIAVGQCQQSGHIPPQVGWFLKLDSNGCEIENCLTGISKSAIENPQFAIFPNPAHDNFSLDIENPLLQGGSLDLYNIDGKKLCSTANNFSRQTKVDISQFPNGIYLWRYTAPNQMVQNGKVVKE